MNMQAKSLIISVLLIFVIGAWGVQSSLAQDKDDYKGWEFGSVYNKLYDPSEWDKLKGECLKFKKVIPLPGMAPGVALIMRDREGEVVTVHMGPEAYIEKQNIGVRKGDKITVKGVWVEINDEDIFIGSKVKKGEYFEFKFRRTKDGKPYWSMTQEELATQ
ncbi:hypothetical protein ACFL9U_11890 [Thermodesulfobacteriota bacterium]